MSLGQSNKKFDWLNDLTIRDKDIAIKTPTTAITPYVRFISSTC